MIITYVYIDEGTFKYSKEEDMVNHNNFIDKLKNRDLRALDYLVDNYGDFVIKVSYSVLQDRELSEECTNDVMLKVWNNISSFKGVDEQFPKWLAVITKRYAIDMIRREKRHKNNVLLNEDIKYATSNIEEAYEQKEEVEVVKREIDNLDTTTKEIFMRKFFKGQRVTEISKELGLTSTAVSNRLLRGKRKITQVLGRR